MRLSLALAALLCFTTWMSTVHANHGPVANCLCPVWSNTKVRIERIVNYTHQTGGICPITAIIFHTTAGKNICSDPNSSWARRVKLRVDEEKKKKKALQEMGQNEDGSTSNITPAASTASKNTPKTRRRYGRRRLRKRFRRWRRGQAKRA